jgi:hypothetical protein
MRRFVAVLAAAAAAAGLECPGADVADVAARVEQLGANASTAAVERVLEAAVAASARARAHRRVALVKTHKTASGTGQEQSDSSSLQHERSARARSGKSIRASRPFKHNAHFDNNLTTFLKTRKQRGNY